MRDKLRHRGPATAVRGGASGPAMISFVGPSNSGKTTLLSALIAELVRRGIRVGAVKHSRRDFSLDVEGKDSDRFKKAGAGSVLAVSPRSVGFVSDAPPRFSPRDAAAFFPRAEIVLVEGWKDAGLPKVVVTGDAARVPRVGNVIAAVGGKDAGYRAPRFSPDDIRGLADFVLEFSRLSRKSGRGAVKLPSDLDTSDVNRVSRLP